MTWEGSPIPGGWVFQHEDSPARIILDYIMPKGSGLEAWVELRHGDDPRPVAAGTRNLMLPNAAQPFLQGLPEDTHSLWREGIATAFYDTVEAWREGAATVDLMTVEPETLKFYVDPLIEQGGNTRLIAPGGSGKSLIAMALALTVTTGSRKFLGLAAQVTGPVMYLDWETNQSTHARRIEALCRGADTQPPGKDLLLYRQEALPLYKTAQAIQRAAEKAEVVMLVVDSRMWAAGPSGQSSGEEATANLTLALREIGRPAVIVDHKSQEKITKNILGGYGSVYNQNAARMEWEFTKYQALAENDHLFQLTLTKENNVGKLPPLGFRLQTAGGKQGITRATFTRVKPETIGEPVDYDDLAQRIFTLFDKSSEPMTTKQIGDSVGESADTVRSRMNRDHRFVNVQQTKGKPGLWRPADEYLDGPRDDGFQASLDQLEEIPLPPEDDIARGDSTADVTPDAPPPPPSDDGEEYIF